MSKEPENVQYRHLYKAVFVKQLQKIIYHNIYKTRFKPSKLILKDFTSLTVNLVFQYTQET